jgi:hypothetical protein
MGLEALAPYKQKWSDNTLQLEKELRERTDKFNASIISFQQILIGINQ